MKFTDYYGLSKSQDELDFVDIDLKNDTPLFIDPWLVKDVKSDFCKKAAENLHSFFDEVLISIREGDRDRAMHLLDHLHEINWTHFGYSVKGMRGKAIAKEHAGQIYYAIKNSKAFKTGALKDIEDVALLIEGVGKDKISDAVTNICLPMLVEYTNKQAEEHAIPQKVIGEWKHWNATTKKWETGDQIKLPTYNGKPILLVPKSVVNLDLAVNSEDFYEKYILPYEQQQHLGNPSSGLCRILKDGTRKEPSKKDLRKIVPFNNDKIVEYVNDNPDLLRKYKKDLTGKKSVKRRRKKQL